MDTLKDNVESILKLIYQKHQNQQRILIGIAGPPGSGKSTLAESVVSALNNQSIDRNTSALLPMDGFHYDNEILIQRHLLPRKGSPETFDVNGLSHLLTNVKKAEGDIRYPIFFRKLDRSFIDAGLLKKEVDIIIVEGNYLLLDAPEWRDIAQLFDMTVFLRSSLSILEERLKSRWLGLGYSLGDALKKTHDNDLVNAKLVLNTSLPADLTLYE